MSTNRFYLTVLALLSALALVACGAQDAEPTAAPDEAPTPTGEEQVAQEALPPARAALAGFLGVGEDALTLEKIEDAEWSDSCLGLGGPAESCLAAITPGYTITFNAGGQSYAVRTDLSGSAVRVEAAYGGQVPGAPEGTTPGAAIMAQERIVAETGLPAAGVEIVGWNAAEWPNGCLGLPEEGELCAEVITPGYLVVLRAGDRVFNARTDERGENVRVQETADTAAEYPVSVVKAREALAARLGASADAVSVVTFERAEWSDSCLGLGGPAESCLAAMTPGWRVLLSYEGTVTEARTDESGDVVRLVLAAEG